MLTAVLIWFAQEGKSSANGSAWPVANPVLTCASATDAGYPATSSPTPSSTSRYGPSTPWNCALLPCTCTDILRNLRRQGCNKSVSCEIQVDWVDFGGGCDVSEFSSSASEDWEGLAV